MLFNFNARFKFLIPYLLTNEINVRMFVMYKSNVFRDFLYAISEWKVCEYI